MNRVLRNDLCQPCLSTIMDDIPVLCEPCLGESSYIRMYKDINGGECKFCTRRFNQYSWNIDGHKRRTVICKACARQKNCCQSCMLDLTFGLPISIRDSALKLADPASGSNSGPVVNRQWKALATERAIAEGSQPLSDEKYSNPQLQVATLLKSTSVNRLKKSGSKHNDQIEADTALLQPSTDQPDPLDPPKKKSKTTLYLNSDSSVDQNDIMHYLTQFGPLQSIKVSQATSIEAHFIDRTSAENAALRAKRANGHFRIRGNTIKVAWDP
ncbi:hypothetical protein CANCADRAFT_116791 [Tortispora caseinolytica NRRL Y-17796]|uniref:Pre-mRNA-splicing factor SLT11 n=1 Tax=Tortispora caseinolytica NRRL Y-17796 TaxID=767744 RepID=A0A1E4THA3_9ASCO|nr:hypothetical protein CANCADRAFT_116791 [Tortispora caseinolytica NRRL Y-17796]